MNSNRRRGDPTHPTHSTVQATTLFVAVVFLLVGLAGFVPGLTTDYARMGWAGPDSGALLLGLFQVSVLHNVVHLVFGLIGLAAVRSPHASRSYLLVGGVVYLALWVYGLVIGDASAANIVPLNTADGWLHLLLGAGMVVLSLALPRVGSEAPAAQGHDVTYGDWRRDSASS